MERLDRPTQYRLLESVPDGPFWRPGELSLSSDDGPRFRLLENVQPTQPQQKKPGWGRKAWNATKYVAGLVSKGAENASPLGQSKMIGQALGWNDQTPWIDKAQDVVSLVGIVDPTGIADVSNAIVYGARGKGKEAAISLAGAAVPYAGDLAKLGKFARGTAKAAQEGRAVARTAHVGAAAAKADMHSIKAARDAAKGSRTERIVRAQAGRAVGRQGRTVAKAVTGTGKLRGQVGKLDTELGRRFGSRYEKGKASLQSGFRQKAQGAFDAVKDAVAQKPEPTPPKAGEPQEVPPPKPEGRLVRKTVHDQKPVQASPETRAPAPSAPAKPEATGSKPAGPSKTGGLEKTPRAGKSLVPVDTKCPKPDTKTSKWGAKPGFKRCHPQSPNRAH